MFHPHIFTLEECRNWGIEHKEFDESFLAAPWEHGCIYSSFRNTNLAFDLLTPIEKCVGTIIFVHGISTTRYSMYKYMKPFWERHWNVLAFDLPGHGGSPAGKIPVPGFGYYEKYDLDVVVTWVRSRWGSTLPVALVGESMGAATVLQYAPLGAPAGTESSQWKIQAVIADCPYSSIEDELTTQFKTKKIPLFIAKPAQKMVDILVWHRYKYHLSDISPEDAILKTNVPILFIHGMSDTLVPYWMSEKMVEERKKVQRGVTEIFLVPGAGHAQNVIVSSEQWFRKVFDFLERQIST
jgi:pimeloyl-ACP methyl ester carboxylesterase